MQKRTPKSIERSKVFQLAMVQVQKEYVFSLIERKTNTMGVQGGADPGKAVGIGLQASEGKVPGSSASPESGMAECITDPVLGQKGELRATSKRKLKQLQRKLAHVKARSMAKSGKPMAAIWALKRLDVEHAVQRSLPKTTSRLLQATRWLRKQLAVFRCDANVKPWAETCHESKRQHAKSIANILTKTGGNSPAALSELLSLVCLELPEGVRVEPPCAAVHGAEPIAPSETWLWS